MTETHTTQCGSRPDERSLTFEISARLDNLAMIRTVVAAAAMFDDMDIDTVADLKLATDEACTRLIRASVPEAILTVRLNFHSDWLAIEAFTHCLSGDVFPLESFSWHVLNSLVDDVKTFERDGPDCGDRRVVGITMTTRRDSNAAVRVAHG
ncbi:ATP-binding protein [Mycobacteroides chelonae]|uniref:ATP-binding protein n=2 Tax=Mycobacteroides chelonae TaxID=1774 RepID=UPI001C2BE44D|nr:ATP-binding protein [Mycobacteroides chelonae]MBV0920023.1 ATP-binding protein [Mycobacteroides chelonae]